eukprot:Sspe_Gene.95624::Locus_67903_Transcript_3_4_Confidence_0.333_Length_800::g.95624::m.95624
MPVTAFLLAFTKATFVTGAGGMIWNMVADVGAQVVEKVRGGEDALTGIEEAETDGEVANARHGRVFRFGLWGLLTTYPKAYGFQVAIYMGSLGSVARILFYDILWMPLFATGAVAFTSSMRAEPCSLVKSHVDRKWLRVAAVPILFFLPFDLLVALFAPSSQGLVAFEGYLTILYHAWVAHCCAAPAIDVFRPPVDTQPPAGKPSPDLPPEQRGDDETGA